LTSSREAFEVSSGASDKTDSLAGLFDVHPWGWRDLVAVLVWTMAIGGFFWEFVSLRRALFYFDITEINYPYRAFFAEELRAGRWSRWCPGLYCGMPLFSESQAGYLHPLKYLLYPWMETWQAFNLDTVISIWLAGVGTYGWLRRHVGAAGALTGAAIVGASGYVWGHIIHTSMINALASVPFVLWGLEASWSSGRWRGVVLASGALAFQVFAGHLQDALSMMGLVVFYACYRAATEPRLREGARAIFLALVLVGLGVLMAAVQGIPSLELLGRSPRAGGLSWEDLTFASWSPELLPTVVVREAYGTRARDTDWMDGFYPYHEMNTYLGLIAIVLAVVGANGAGLRDRWVNFWVILIFAGLVLILGRFTCLFDLAHRVPVLGSSREPVRFHLWVALGVAALAACGVDRLGRPGVVSLRKGLTLAGVLCALSIPILIYVYLPVWTEAKRWTQPYHLDRYRWLARELIQATLRTGLLAALAWLVARRALGAASPARRARWAALLPCLVLADLLSAHLYDVPGVTPRYWTDPPESARRLSADPATVRVFGIGDKSAGEPGYASEAVDFLPVRDPLDWSLPVVWHLAASKGNTPMISRRLLGFAFHASGRMRFDIEGDTHIVTGRGLKNEFGPVTGPRAGAAFIHRNGTALPRARLAGKPIYVPDPGQGIETLDRLGLELSSHVVVEDPARPLAEDAVVSGTARIVEDLPERVVVATEASVPAYLVLADTFDPGWSATVDGNRAPIRPAYLAFRAVFLPAGKHTVAFRYSPAGFELGLALSVCGCVLALVLWFWPGRMAPLEAAHGVLSWPPRWRTCVLVAALVLVVVSAIGIGPNGRPHVQSRWRTGFHRFTWGSGKEAMRVNRQ
jgi:hypothetical protein